MSSSEIAAQILERELTSPRRWLRNDLESADGSRRCLWGAAGKILGSGDEEKMQDFASRAAGIIMAEYPDRADCERTAEGIMVGFNDHPRTRYADVRRVLEKIAAGGA